MAGRHKSRSRNIVTEGPCFWRQFPSCRTKGRFGPAVCKECAGPLPCFLLLGRASDKKRGGGPVFPACPGGDWLYSLRMYHLSKR